MSALLDWLNQHAAAVVALGGVISATATLAIAVLTVGTWRLYRLERRRQDVQTGALAAHLVHCAVRLGEMRGVIYEDESDGEGVEAHAPRLARELREVRVEILRRFDAAVATSFEVAAALDAAAGLTKDAARQVDFASSQYGWGRRR